MKLKYILIPAAIVSIFSACSRTIDIDDPSTEVFAVNQRSIVGDTLYYNLGDTAKFLIKEASDNIVFYSGEPGKNYDFAMRTAAYGPPTMSFTSKAEFGTQLNTLQVLASNKVKVRRSVAVTGGITTTETIIEADWKDITSRAQLATSATTVNSGNIDLSDIITGPGDSLFIAFKYTGATGSTQRTWTITNLVVNGPLSDGTVNPLLSLANDNAYWMSYLNSSASTGAKWTNSTSELKVVGGGATAPSDTAWIMSKPMYVGRIMPDVPSLMIKSTSTPVSDITVNGIAYTTSYRYNTKKGLYRATFLYSNNSIDKTKAATKQFWIRIN